LNGFHDFSWPGNETHPPWLHNKCLRKTANRDGSVREFAKSRHAQKRETIKDHIVVAFIGDDPKGRLYTKQQMIGDTRNAPKHFVSNRLNDVKVRFYGKTAVAQGSETWEKHSGERGRFVWTDTWLQRNGRWQIVAAEDLIAPEKAD